jgi:DdrB-like protein
MTDQQFEILRKLLERIAIAVEAQRTAPNYQADLKDFAQFDWSSIGANVRGQDRDGVAIVEWRQNTYLRRSASNKFQPAIWFSRSIGKDELGNTKYERLITFKPKSEAEPLPDKVRRF